MVAAGGSIPGSPLSRTSQSQEHDPESPSLGKRPGPWPPRMEPLPPDHSYNPRVLGTWARRTGFKSNMSGETASAVSDVEINIAEIGKGSMTKTLRTANPTTLRDAQNDNLHSNGVIERDKSKEPAGIPSASPRLASEPLFAGKKVADPEVVQSTPCGPTKMETIKPFKETEVDMMSQSQDADDGILARHSHMKYDLTDSPGLVPLMLYGIQHYFSIAGSLVLIPLVIVPAMGGKDEETAKVISTMLLVSGITTLLHTYFGSRLPLIQGASFAYLAPALAIIKSFDISELPEDNRFRHIMRELQGAVIISSIFQVLVGYTGLMAWVLRVINPVVVAPTVAAVGLAFFSYGFPVLGRCVEIGIPQIMVVIFFALYLRKISIFGHSIFQIYAVPLGLGITWAYAFLLTETGAYDYNGCSLSTTGTAMPGCEKHVFTMRYCRTDVSKALEETDWIRFPYPLQWGAPTFRLKTGLVMIAASVIASLDSSEVFIFTITHRMVLGHQVPLVIQILIMVLTAYWLYSLWCAMTAYALLYLSGWLYGCCRHFNPDGTVVGSYHAASLLVASRAPPPGLVCRGIGLEGLTSALAGLWGTGAGATTLTENVHTIAVTKMGSRRAVEFGALVLIVLSFIGKIGALVASIPQVIAAALLCVMWAMLAALGLSNLRYSETGSSRNVLIVGLSLFLSLSIPAYFQQYNDTTKQPVPPYFQQYIVASHGPVQTKNHVVNFVLNTVLSFHMVVAFLVAFILDNTVPGSRQERGIYVWSDAKIARSDPATMKEYELPFGLGKFFSWLHWLGM